jgi:hypothetical protein
MQTFESSRPSQPVWSPRVKLPSRRKTTRYRGVSPISRGLRVRNWATELSFRPLVSEAAFWCRVFAGPMASQSCAVLRLGRHGSSQLPPRFPFRTASRQGQRAAPGEPLVPDKSTRSLGERRGTASSCQPLCCVPRGSAKSSSRILIAAGLVVQNLAFLYPAQAGTASTALATAAAASWMTATTSPGCESNDMWLERSTVVFACIRLASAAWSSALTRRSSVVTMNQEGFVFQAATVTVWPNAFPASRPWVTASARASAAGMSGAMLFRKPSTV